VNSEPNRIESEDAAAADGREALGYSLLGIEVDDMHGKNNGTISAEGAEGCAMVSTNVLTFRSSAYNKIAAPTGRPPSV